MAAQRQTRAPEPEPDETSGEGDGARKPFLLRLPPPLMAELREWASQEVRSLNGQIEFLLREAVKARRRRSADP